MGFTPVVTGEPISSVIGTVALGLAAAFRLTGRRGGLRKFHREMAPDLQSKARETGRPTFMLWHEGELLSVDPQGTIQSWGKGFTFQSAWERLQEIARTLPLIVAWGDPRQWIELGGIVSDILEIVTGEPDLEPAPVFDRTTGERDGVDRVRTRPDNTWLWLLLAAGAIVLAMRRK